MKVKYVYFPRKTLIYLKVDYVQNEFIDILEKPSNIKLQLVLGPVNKLRNERRGTLV